MENQAIEIDPGVRNEQACWATPETLRYYQTHRRSREELYPSERYFLPELLPGVRSVLDVGCAAGGFCNIMRSFNPAVRYVGVDINPEFIAIARRDYPAGEFHVSDGIHFPFPAQSFDLVHCTGLLHLNSRYKEMVQAMWDQAQSYLLCDFRLTWGPTLQGEFRVDFEGKGHVGPRLPYHLLNVSELMAYLQALTPRPGAIHAKGYSHEVSSTASVSLKTALMVFFLLDRQPQTPRKVDIVLDET